MKRPTNKDQRCVTNNTSHNPGVARAFRRRLLRLVAPLLAAFLGVAFLTSQIGSIALDRSHFDRNPVTSRGLANSVSTPRALSSANVTNKPLWLTWLDAWRNPSGSTPPIKENEDAAPQTKRPRVWVDVERLARRHPAWQLADRLERGVENSSRFRSRFVNVSSPHKPLRSVSQDLFWNNFARYQFVARENNADRVLDVESFLRVNRATSRATSNATSDGSSSGSQSEEFLIGRAQRMQERSLSSLSRDLSRALGRERILREREARALLDEEVEAARSAELSSLDPITLSPAEQLELTNLRLKLLPSSILSDEEKRQARVRLSVLQSRWDEALRRQEAQHLVKIEEQRDIEPRRLRREGEAAIAQAQNRLQLADAARLRTLRSTQSDLIARDFQSLQPLQSLQSRWQPRSQREVLATALAWPLLPRDAGKSNERGKARSNKSRHFVAPTIAVLPLSERVLVPTAAPVPADQMEQIRQLRAQARREAQGWTRIVAQRNGWQVVPSPRSTSNQKPARNGTEDVWRAWKM